MPTDLASHVFAAEAEIAEARAERDALAARWAKGADYLAAMEARGESETAEFERLFAEWEQVDAQLRAVLDRIEIAELNERIERDAKRAPRI